MEGGLGLAHSYRTVGLMSGTSLDGLDIAVSRFRRRADGGWEGDLEHFVCEPFPEEWAVRLAALPEASAEEWCAAAAAWSTWCGDRVRMRVDLSGVDLVAFHGQTVFHRPADRWTGQLASGAHLHCALGGVPVVCDFRSLDVAAGGQGAPLVPVADALLFADVPACLNLGGFANISMSAQDGRRIAWDIGPCNLLLNTLASRLGAPYDRDGAWAAAGTWHPALYDAWCALPYFSTPAPKSLGREWLAAEVLPRIPADLSPQDALATAARFIATAIRRDAGGARTLLTGGGAHNAHLVALLTAPAAPGLGGPPLEAQLPARALIDGKEAHAFGFLGLLRALGEPNAWPSVTGAVAPTVGGALWGHLSLRP